MFPLLLLLAPLRAHAADVVVFGDSWAEGAASDLQAVLWSRGFTDLAVDGRGVGGTTAEHWATEDPQALPDAVSANPDARWVWLSIGGNDLFWHHANGIGAQTAADNDTHLRAMLDALFAVHPDVKVVMFGYDFVNFEQSWDCVITGLTIFGQGATTETVNRAFLAQVGDVQAAVAADYPQVTYVPSVWGTLQAAEGVPGAPNVLLPSPAKYFADCIHPTHEGYRLILGTLVDAYWGDPDGEAWSDTGETGDTGSPDTGDTGDTGDTADTEDSEEPVDTDGTPEATDPCGCVTAGTGLLGPALLAMLSVGTRRGRGGARSCAPRPTPPR